MPANNSFTYTLQNLDEAAKWLIEKADAHTLWCFYGEMGAGKTTLIKEICKQLGITQNVSSPTFSLVNEYVLPNGKLLFHFDFYRIKSIEEVYDIGYETYFESGAICLIEWPEMISEILEGEQFISLQIKVTETARYVQIGE